MTELLVTAPSLSGLTVTDSPGPSLTLAGATRALNAWVQVDLDALDANVRTLRSTLGPAVEVIAVVKANAYGAGAAPISAALERAGVDRMAVVWMAEALALRESGIRAPIIVLGHAFPEDAAVAVEHGITLTVDSMALGEALSREAQAQGRDARVHIHIDSGLHRDGLPVGEAVRLAEALRQLPGIQVEGLSTHMANADEADDSFSAEQHAQFAEACSRLPWIPYRHSANTATALRHGEFRLDGVRLGLALHGVLPENTPDTPLKPILSVRARVARVVDVAPGEGVSYGLTWRAGKSSRVALIPVGYADGWRRSLGNDGAVLIAGQRCPMVGRVCMDQFLVDVTALPGVAVGDECVLLGKQGADEITATEVAKLAHTIPWDVFASLQARLPRVYHRGGVVETLA